MKKMNTNCGRQLSVLVVKQWWSSRKLLETDFFSIVTIEDSQEFLLEAVFMNVENKTGLRI